MQSFLSDLRLSVRRLKSRPVATLVAIVTLSLGIGAVSTMYLLFRAATNDLPPVPQPDRLARVFIIDEAARDARIPPAPVERHAWLEAPPAGIAIAVVEDLEVNIDPGNQVVSALRVSPAYFDVAGVRPQLGRTFAGSAREVIVGRRLWDRLPGPVRSLGSRIDVDGEPCAIVGVMPAGFWMPVRGVDVWLPATTGDGPPSAFVIARLGEGVTPTRASSALAPVVHHLRGERHEPTVRLLATDATVRSTTGILMMVGPAVLVLLAVCANIAALLLGDVHRRRQELAVRAALGASRWRLAREVYGDALVIALVAAVLSLVGAFWSVRAIGSAFQAVSPGFASMLPPFATVAPMALTAALAAVLGIGYAPALFASRTRMTGDLSLQRPSPLLRRGRYGGADLLLVLQIAMAASLVLWTAIFASIFDRVFALAPHVPASRVWAIEIASRKSAQLPGELAEIVLAQAQRTPGIEAAGLLRRGGGARQTWVASSRGGAPMVCSAWLEQISAGYFGANAFPLKGSVPREGEVVLNEAAATRCGDPDTIRAQAPVSPLVRVTGTVDDHLFGSGIPGIASRGPATVYSAISEPLGRAVLLNLRSAEGSAVAPRALRDDLARRFPQVRFSDPTTLAAEAERQFGGGVLIGKLLGMLALLALLFGIIGVHASMTQALALRTRELGVRIALGATSRNVIGMTVGHQLAPAVIGIALGACIAIGGLFTLGTDDAPMIRQLAVLTAQSPATWAGLLALLVVSAILSAAVPIMRALRVDPAAILRQE